MISKSQKAHWKQLRLQLVDDVWRNGYRIVEKELIRFRQINLSKQRKLETVQELDSGGANEQNCGPTQNTEAVIKTTKKWKALRLPSNPSSFEVIRAATEVTVEYVLSVFNNLLRRKSFPELWRMTGMVLLEQQRQPLDTDPLSVIEKSYERLIGGRMEKELIRSDS